MNDLNIKASENIDLGHVDNSVRAQTSGGNIKITSIGEGAMVSTSGGNIKLGNVGKSVQAHTSGGNIVIGDVGEDVKALTSGGNIKVGKVCGSASLKTSGGNISLAASGGAVAAESSGGEIMLESVSGPVKVKTEGGDVTANFVPDEVMESTIAARGGDITIYLPATARALIQARVRVEERSAGNTEHYDIHSEFEAADYERDEQTKQVFATYSLNGGGEIVNLEAVSGNIYLKTLQPQSQQTGQSS